MKYRDVVEIPQPLEKVKQVRDSADADAAASDVATYVISDRMADQLANVVAPQLRFDTGADHAGLLVVGTYGTGKTHLMSVIAALCEFPNLVDDLTNDSVRAAFEPIAGKFKAIRFDVGASTMSLRDIVCTELTKGLDAMGITFEFPPLSEVTNSKDDLVAMMGEFEKSFPDQGLLFVVDELLDFLRGRKDAELILDLAFLREVGEVCKNTRFRIIGGLQESLFDNPRFAGVADAIKRVRDRFEQLRIAREDVAYVVTERLLPKSAAQKNQIRDHLQPFTPMFEGMAERLDDFVDLFPIHPAFLRTFEQLTLVEKREVLRTVEAEIVRLSDEDIPADAPGLVCIDSYRARLVDEASMRTVPEVQEVLDKSEVVRTKIATVLPEKQYVETATRIVDALAVHRLTTDDVHARIGLTVDELRDQLCLLPPGLPKKDALFLHTTIETILAKTMTAVSGQFLSRNDDNGQVFLDIDKDVDYDKLIDQRAESLDDDRLDAAYYRAVETTLGISDNPYVAGYKIWSYALAWPDKHSERSGYLFMGAPNERSTAQPPRDFYLYFLQPYGLPKYIDDEKPDEVFLRLADPADEFTTALRRYAGALERAKESTSDRRPIYESKANEALQAMVAWLRSNLATAMEVTYRGETRTIGAWLTTAKGERSSVVDQIRSIATHVLVGHFDDRYPGYPTFGVEITPGNLGDAVHSALAMLADLSKATTAARKVLASLELLASDGSITADGGFATALAAQLSSAKGKVVNRSELLTERDPGLRSWAPWHLEPPWLVVVAAALVHLGKAELAYADFKVDALSIGKLPRLSLDELVEFKHLALPAALPTDQLAAAVEILGLAPGAVQATGATPELVTEVATRATTMLRDVVEAEGVFDGGIDFWGHELIDFADERRARVAALRTLLEDLKARNSVGKLNKFSRETGEIDVARAGRDELARLDMLRRSVSRLEPAAGYLREAVACFGDAFDASVDAADLRGDMIAVLTADTVAPDQVAALSKRADALRTAFAKAAAAFYRHRFLDAAGDKRKQQLLEGDTWATLGVLSMINLLPGAVVTDLQSDLADIGTLLELNEKALESSVKVDGRVPCEVTGPSAEARLEAAERRVDELYDNWTRTLVDNVSDSELDNQLELLDAGQRQIIEALRADRALPVPVTAAFANAVNTFFDQFKVHAVARSELVRALFPAETVATPDELRERLASYLADLAEGEPPDKVRIVLAADSEGA